MAEAGADAALVVTPCYFKSLMNNQALEQHYTKVNEIKHPIFIAHQRSSGKVMFSVVSVCQSFCLFTTGSIYMALACCSPVLNTQGPPTPSRHIQTCSTCFSPYRDHPWICLNLFSLNLTIQGPHPGSGWNVGSWPSTEKSSC